MSKLVFLTGIVCESWIRIEDKKHPGCIFCCCLQAGIEDLLNPNIFFIHWHASLAKKKEDCKKLLLWCLDLDI